MKIKKSDPARRKSFRASTTVVTPDLNGRPDIGHAKLGKIL